MPWVATVNAFLFLDFSRLPVQAHDELKSKFIVATAAGIPLDYQSATLMEPC
jgi:hypothetical protein